MLKIQILINNRYVYCQYSLLMIKLSVANNFSIYGVIITAMCQNKSVKYFLIS